MTDNTKPSTEFDHHRPAGAIVRPQGEINRSQYESGPLSKAAIKGDDRGGHLEQSVGHL